MNPTDPTIIRRVAAITVAVLVAATCAHAQLTIDNAGFESPDTTNGDGTVDLWSEFDGNGTSQVLDEGGAAFDSWMGGSVAAPEGSQVLRLIESPTGGESVFVSQDIGTLTQSDIDSGALSFSIGRGFGEEIPVTSIGMVFSDGNGQIGGGFINGLAAPAAGSFEARTIAISDFISASGETIEAGDSVNLRLVAREGDFAGLAGGLSGVSGTDGSTSRERVGFDNLQIVPEPGAYALFGGLLALGAVVLRRRRS